MNVVACDEAGLEAAARVLLSGGVAVIPTDTVYGLAAHPGFPAAVERLYTIKGREAKKPIALLASDVDAIARFGYPLVGEASRLASYWPGALTLVIEPPATNAQPPAAHRGRFALPTLNSQLSTLNSLPEGFRIPDHAWTRRLLAKCGGVLRVTSANLSGQRPATDAPQALADVGLSADLVVDDGVSPGGVPSTVVRVNADGTHAILRQGAIAL